MKTLQVKTWLIAITLITTTLSLTANNQLYTDSTGIAFPDEIPAQFPGGITALADFIQAHLAFPMEARENGVDGIVVVRFDVMEDGSIKNIKVVKSLGFGLDDEAVRVVKLMPAWIPAQQNGSPVSTRYIIPLRFELTT